MLYCISAQSNERWMRIHAMKGDMLILPAGIYHRFSLDTRQHIVANRLFIGEPVWTPHYRPADNTQARSDYLSRLAAYEDEHHHHDHHHQH